MLRRLTYNPLPFKIVMISSLFPLLAFLSFSEIPHDNTIIIAEKKIEFDDYPGAFNPSLARIDNGYLLTFRYCPDPVFNPHISWIGIVHLNETFDPITEPQILNTRLVNQKIAPQAEDARLFFYRDRLFLLFNDNPHIDTPSLSDRRDMYIAELFSIQNSFQISIPLKLFYSAKNSQLWEKNWVPFTLDQNLFFSYSILPHEVLQPNFFDGECFASFQTETPHLWKYGTVRGGTPALLIDGEYLSFFHSSVVIPPSRYWDTSCWFYFMGAYTFSPTPPFTITKMTQIPIFKEGFYDPDSYGKKVIFPGGFVDAGPVIYLAYGKDDCEIWIATLDKKALYQALRPLR